MLADCWARPSRLRLGRTFEAVSDGAIRKDQLPTFVVQYGSFPQATEEHGPSMNPISRPVIWGATIALLATAAIHFVEAPDAFSEATYKGVLFVANGVGALIAVGGILRGGWSWAWLLGVVVAGGAILGYIASRTVGLPGIPAEPDAWLEPLGVASLLAEGIVVVLFLIVHRARFRSSSAAPM